MTKVPNRVRYEVLRRDKYTCRYCGAQAPDVPLEVDAVVPEALGGSHKDPANLATACKPCNGGKSSSNPDAPLVSEVSESALQWAGAMKAAQAHMLSDIDGREADREQFAAWWDVHGYPKPDDWAYAVDQLTSAGLPMRVIKECIDLTAARRQVRWGDKFRYMCGAAWRKAEEIRKRAERLTGNVAEGCGDEDEDLGAEAVQNWCRIILGQRDPAEVERAARQCRDRAGYEEPSGILWFVIQDLGAERSALYSGLRHLMEALPDEVGIDLIRKHEEYWLERGGPGTRRVALWQAAQWTTEHYAGIRARKELAEMPAGVAQAWIQRARDESADFAERVNEDYYAIEAARLARKAAAEVTA